jgi:hypothetical protein
VMATVMAAATARVSRFFFISDVSTDRGVEERG